MGVLWLQLLSLCCLPGWVELADGEEELPTSSLTKLMTALSKTHARLKQWPSLIDEDIFGKNN